MSFEIKFQIDLNLYSKSVWKISLEKEKENLLPHWFSAQLGLVSPSAQPLPFPSSAWANASKAVVLSRGLAKGPAQPPAFYSLACLTDVSGPLVRSISFLQLMSEPDTIIAAAAESAPPTPCLA